MSTLWVGEKNYPTLLKHFSCRLPKEPHPRILKDRLPLARFPRPTGSIESVDPGDNRISLLLATGETGEINVDEFLTVADFDGAAGTLQDLQPGDSVEVGSNPAANVASSIAIRATTAVISGSHGSRISRLSSRGSATAR
jgi:hypothetical protein